MNIFYYDVAIPIPIRETFTYECKESIQVGSRVLVEFRKKKVVGHIVKAVLKKPNFDTIQISEILDEEPIFKSNDIDILFWLADYYQHPIGEVFDNFCPPILRKPVKLHPVFFANSLLILNFFNLYIFNLFLICGEIFDLKLFTFLRVKYFFFL